MRTEEKLAVLLEMSSRLQLVEKVPRLPGILMEPRRGALLSETQLLAEIRISRQPINQGRKD
jgi:hypothetical protein